MGDRDEAMRHQEATEAMIRMRDPRHDTRRTLRERVQREARIAELEAALSLLWAETIASGNAESKDFGWPKVRAAVLAALERERPQNVGKVFHDSGNAFPDRANVDRTNKVHGIGDAERAFKEASGWRMRPDGSYFKPGS